jgi:hypothetical protein
MGSEFASLQRPALGRAILVEAKKEFTSADVADK